MSRDWAVVTQNRRERTSSVRYHDSVRLELLLQLTEGHVWDV